MLGGELLAGDFLAVEGLDGGGDLLAEGILLAALHLGDALLGFLPDVVDFAEDPALLEVDLLLVVVV